MKRALVLVSLLSFTAFAADPLPADAPRLDAVKLCDPATDEKVARYVVFLEEKNVQLEKTRIEPLVLVLLVAGGALLGAGLGVGITLATRPAPAGP